MHTLDQDKGYLQGSNQDFAKRGEGELETGKFLWRHFDDYLSDVIWWHHQNDVTVDILEILLRHN